MLLFQTEDVFSSVISPLISRCCTPCACYQAENVQQFKVCCFRTQKFFTIPSDPQ